MLWWRAVRCGTYVKDNIYAIRDTYAVGNGLVVATARTDNELWGFKRGRGLPAAGWGERDGEGRVIVPRWGGVKGGH